jgi:hypothetical protein
MESIFTLRVSIFKPSNGYAFLLTQSNMQATFRSEYEFTAGKKVKVFRYKPDVALGVPGG